MRTYFNQIEPKILQAEFTEEELSNYKNLTTQKEKLHHQIRTLEMEAAERLESYTIGNLEKIEFNYARYSNTFYMSYTSDEPKPDLRWHQKVRNLLNF